jgi:tetratricopeptide (TPR) repeat protein
MQERADRGRFKTIHRITLLTGLISSFAIPLLPQSAPAPKANHQQGSPFAVEDLTSSAASLREKESSVRTALSHDPDSAELLYALALVLREEGKPHESLDSYTAAARYRKPTTEELRSVALDYVLLDDYDDAIRWLEIAVRMEPDNVRVLYALGRCYYSKDRYQDAGKMFERVLTIDPRHIKAEENLGLVLDAMNEPARAEQTLRKAVSLANANGLDEWPFLDLGSFLVEQDRAKEAVDPLRVAVKIKPDCADCHQKLGRALIGSQDTNGGIAELEKAEQLDPKDPKTHYELGRALRSVGQIERAKQELQLSQSLYKTHSQN